MMTKPQMIAELLKWNRATNKTFQSRARNARLICSASTDELEWMIDAIA